MHGSDHEQHKLDVNDRLIRHGKDPPANGSERRVHIIPHHAENTMHAKKMAAAAHS